MNSREFVGPVPLLRTIAIATGMLVLAVVVALGVAVPPAASGQDAECDNAEFRTGPSADLPDCRAYEQVSPVRKYGQAVWFGTISTGSNISRISANPAWLAPGSDRVLVAAGHGDPERGMLYPQSAVRDEASGWKSSSLIAGPPPTTQLDGPASSFARQIIPSADRSSILFSIGIPLSPEQPPATIYSGNGGVHKTTPDGSTAWISKPSSPDADLPPGSDGVSLGKFVPVGGSDDLSTVYFMTRQTLTPEDIASGRTWDQGWALYKVEDGVLSNAGTLPDGTLDISGSRSAGVDLRGGGNEVVLGNLSPTLGGVRVVSRDGERALFVDTGARHGPGHLPQLYMHRDGQPSVLISKRPEDSAPIADSLGVVPVWGFETGSGESGLALATADEDLDTVLFSSRDALTEGAVDDDSQVNTYLYDMEGGTLELLPELQRPASDASIGSTRDSPGNVYAFSGDGERILFRTPSGEIKLWRDGLPTLTLATGIAANAIPDARFADDDRTLVFASYSPVAGEPNHPAGNSYRQTQLYRLAEDEGTTPACISCPPSDAAVRGVAALELGTTQNSGFGGSQTTATRIVRNSPMSADGTKVYFTSNSTLDSRDQNTVADVYEWDAETENALLISSGDPASTGDGLLDVDASGDNVLFASAVPLAESDVDEIYDFYVARVGGGVSVPPLYEDDESCETDVCQGAPTDGPRTPTAGSVSFSGNGNPKQPRNPKASVKVKRLRTAKGAAAKLRVNVPGPGKLTANGRKIKRTSKRAKGPGTVTLRLKLNAKAKKALRRKGEVKTRARVVYRSSSGERASKKVALKFTKPKSKKRKKGGR